MNKSCANCVFFDTTTVTAQAEIAATTGTAGICRAAPPNVQAANGKAVWSAVVADDWCGTWVIKPGA